VTAIGTLTPAPSALGSGRARSENPDVRRSILGRDGWFAFVLGTVAQTFLVLMVALLAFATLPLALGWDASVVQTGSMRPHIQAGDVVLSSPLPETAPVPLGSVVQFEAPAAGGGEHLVVHRIVAPGATDGTWVTRGDANATDDSTAITRDDITGQGRLLVRWVGLPSMWLSTGQFGSFVAWLLATFAAAWLMIWTWPRRATNTGDEDDLLATPGAGRTGDGSQRARRTMRRTPAILLAATLVAATVAAVSLEHSSAAFTARTSSVNNAFQVGSWSNLSLGRASTYSILAATRITNSESHTTILGSIAVAPGSTVSGLNGADVTGSVDKNTLGARNARTDAIALRDAISVRSTSGAAPAAVTGRLTPGTWRRTGPIEVQGRLTLDAGGDPSASFVLSGSSVTFAPGSSVVLANGASPNKVFFVSSGEVVVNSGVPVHGVLLAQSNIRLERDAMLTGRAYSLQGEVSMKGISVVQPTTAN
jgi:signal peptidase I